MSSAVKNAAAAVAAANGAAPRGFLFHHEEQGALWVLSSLTHSFGNEAAQKISDAMSQARAAGVPWVSVLQTVLPLILQVLAGGGVPWQTILQLVLGLIKPVPPAPAPVA